ncbi:hypothetical protein A4G19_14100 [Pasteurellaceae bacterium Macca]|nr:hypothetical protein [Pasteurellaceae bacterium Macca]
MESFDSDLTRGQSPETTSEPNEREEQYIVQARENEHNRQETVKDELHNWIIWFIRAFLSAALIAGLVYFWHLVTPEYVTWNGCPILRMHFLKAEQLDKLSAFL